MWKFNILYILVLINHHFDVSYSSNILEKYVLLLMRQAIRLDDFKSSCCINTVISFLNFPFLTLRNNKYTFFPFLNNKLCFSNFFTNLKIHLYLWYLLQMFMKIIISKSLSILFTLDFWRVKHLNLTSQYLVIKAH